MTAIRAWAIKKLGGVDLETAAKHVDNHLAESKRAASAERKAADLKHELDETLTTLAHATNEHGTAAAMLAEQNARADIVRAVLTMPASDLGRYLGERAVTDFDPREPIQSPRDAANYRPCKRLNNGRWAVERCGACKHFTETGHVDAYPRIGICGRFVDVEVKVDMVCDDHEPSSGPYPVHDGAARPDQTTAKFDELQSANYRQCDWLVNGKASVRRCGRCSAYAGDDAAGAEGECDRFGAVKADMVCDELHGLSSG